jgi:hypothetical protein
MLQVNATDASDSTQGRLPVPSVYVGEFRGGKLSGQGGVSITGAGNLAALVDTGRATASKQTASK